MGNREPADLKIFGLSCRAGTRDEKKGMSNGKTGRETSKFLKSLGMEGNFEVFDVYWQGGNKRSTIPGYEVEAIQI